MQKNKDLEGFFNYGRKFFFKEEYYKRQYPGIFASDFYVTQLLKNKNFRNSQNYVIKKDNSLEDYEFEGKYIKIVEHINFYKFNFLFFLFKNKKNKVFLLKFYRKVDENTLFYGKNKIYLLIKLNYYKLFIDKFYILGLEKKVSKFFKK